MPHMPCQRRRVSMVSLWLTAVAVFYLTVGVHLLHPLFHLSHHHQHEDSHAPAYHCSESHHHAPCPLYHYCKSLNHLHLVSAPAVKAAYVLTDNALSFPRKFSPQQPDTAHPARAPPSA